MFSYFLIFSITRFGAVFSFCVFSPVASFDLNLLRIRKFDIKLRFLCFMPAEFDPNFCCSTMLCNDVLEVLLSFVTACLIELSSPIYLVTSKFNVCPLFILSLFLISTFSFFYREEVDSFSSPDLDEMEVNSSIGDLLPIS